MERLGLSLLEMGFNLVQVDFDPHLAVKLSGPVVAMSHCYNLYPRLQD